MLSAKIWSQKVIERREKEIYKEKLRQMRYSQEKGRTKLPYSLDSWIPYVSMTDIISLKSWNLHCGQMILFELLPEIRYA